MQGIRVAIAGIGNCASAFVQGLEYYKRKDNEEVSGLMYPKIGSFGPSDIQIVAAFDVDRRKVGKPLEEAIFAKPNCAEIFQREIPPSHVMVQMGPIFDGVAPHMADYPDDEAFRVANEKPVSVIQVLRETKAEILVCYMPVGAEDAVRHYASACIEAGVAMINCVPVFIASDRQWAKEFRDSGVPIIGDDIKSQIGATILHRTLTRLFQDRGVHIDRTYQLNTGGNTDFLNMISLERLKSKKISKTESVQSQLNKRLNPRNIHIGPSDYVPWQGDNKVAFIRIEGSGFGSVSLELEVRLSVQDSPNSAGVAIDAVRCAKLALERGISGPLESVSAFYMKSPPIQLRDSLAYEKTSEFIKEV